MNRETLNSAMLLLQAKVNEQYGVIKDAVRRPAQMGDMESIAQMALQLAQLEQGLSALQTYGADLLKEMDAAANQQAATEVEVEEEDGGEEEDDEEDSPQKPPKVVTPEMSRSLKRIKELQESQKKYRLKKDEE